MKNGTDGIVSQHHANQEKTRANFLVVKISNQNRELKISQQCKNNDKNNSINT
jgi:hypothetical protein